MFLMYVDESGDTGLKDSPSPYFALSGIVVHELNWRLFITDLLAIRKKLKEKYGIGIRDEIHAAEFLRHANPKGLPKHIRLQVLRDNLRMLAQLSYINVTNIVIDKSNKSASYDLFEKAWEALFQRFENTLRYNNFPGPKNPKDYGLVLCDDTNGGKLNRLVRRMAVYNPIPSKHNMGQYRNLPIELIVEDPSMRNSKESLPIQAADLCAFMLYQYLKPNSYVKKKTGHGFFSQLKPILNLKASSTHPLGVKIL